MTVSSLWKVLNMASCGQPVGVDEITTNPSSNNQSGIVRPHTLAVDLSIWICESLTTFGMNEQHANPVLHLVFTRTMKLLNLGLGLVFVVEGKQRIQQSSKAILSKHDKTSPIESFRKRRSGTAFWKACRDSQQLLELLGVPVVRAKCEAEALCALLNARGIVDGVISNDGDCLLFGAKVIYTKYSNENLDNRRVMRYDLNSLYTSVHPPNDEPDTSNGTIERLKFSRYDLIAFAILTGSDLAGNGMEKVGYKKAIRFLRKCQQDNPLFRETAALDEMKAWAKAATANVPYDCTDVKTKCCSRCTHKGSKRGHEKDGCVLCGTGPGEECYLVTQEDRFRLSLRDKALAMKFDPSHVFENYLSPNENQLPMQLIDHGVQMGTPQVSGLMQMSLIVKGHNRHTSQEFVRQSVFRLLSRIELRRDTAPVPNNQPVSYSHAIVGERPVAKAIVKTMMQHQIPCYEVTWVVNATITDENGDGIDGYEYITVEPQMLIKEKYPHLLEAFQQAEIIRAKQGDGMKTFRRDFLQSFVFPRTNQVGEQDVNIEIIHLPKGKRDKKRKDFFNKNPLTLKNQPQEPSKHRRKTKVREGGDDIRYLLRFACNSLQNSPTKASNVPHKYKEAHKKGNRPEEMISGEHIDLSDSPQTLKSFHVASTPKTDIADDEESDLYCAMGGYDIRITPVAANHGAYPPKHIFVHRENTADS